MSILSVDDEPNDAFLLRSAAKRGGLSGEIQFAMNGQEAVDLLKSLQGDRPDLTLLDLKMPQMTGFEVLQWLRQQAELRDVCVAVFTSSSDPGDIARAYELGADFYLVKPLGFQELLHLVKVLAQALADRERGLRLLETSPAFRPKP